MSLTIHTKKQGRLSKRNWMPTSIPAESFRTFAHGISALHIFDHGTKGRLTWYANNCAGHRMWRCNNHKDCDFMVQLKQHAPLDFKFFRAATLLEGRPWQSLRRCQGSHG